ncbi:MAG TPA: DUF1622 domain-containing protein [Actinomycetota bacterium]|nr:DUF1622 domain-containing protein [Actinomycetota bacterium]
MGGVIGSASYEDVMQNVVRGFEVAGVGVLVVGSVLAFVRFVIELFGRPFEEAYEGVRQGVGRAILLGLEVLIIADIVRTITIDPTLESAFALGVIVLVRTFLSFSLEIELEGVVPWRRGSSRRDRPG